MRYGFVFTFAGILTLAEITEGRQFCFEDERITPEGKCAPCELCPSGEGMDFDEKVATNQDGIAIECRKCKPCSAGYWNDRMFGQTACIKCRLNCLLLNRKVYRECGGSNPGQCGACINSMYEDIDQNIESRCMKRVAHEKKAIDVRTQMPHRDDLKEQQLDKSIQSSSRKTSIKKDTQTSFKASILVIPGVLVAVVAIGIAIYHWKKCRRPEQLASPRLGSSGDTIHSNGSSEMGEVNFSNSQNLNKDDDLEVDCPLLTGLSKRQRLPARGPHPELISCLPSSGPAALRLYDEQKHTPNTPVYPKFLLKADDEYIMLTSKSVFDDGKCNPMFRDLGISDQEIYAEGQHFFNHKHDYDHMIRRLLDIWLHKAGRGATFDVLCQALDKNQFHKVSIELLALYQAKCIIVSQESPS